MKVQLWSFGKENSSYVAQGVEIFTGRLRHYCDFDLRIMSAGKNTARSPEVLKRKEAEILLGLMEPGEKYIMLDERGDQLTTLQLADLLRQYRLQASRKLVFVIGGAYGLDNSVLLKAGKVVSLSRLTFPHQMVRLIMAEQLYRAFSIINNEKYHHQ